MTTGSWGGGLIYEKQKTEALMTGRNNIGTKCQASKMP